MIPPLPAVVVVSCNAGPRRHRRGIGMLTALSARHQVRNAAAPAPLTEKLIAVHPEASLRGGCDRHRHLIRRRAVMTGLIRPVAGWPVRGLRPRSAGRPAAALRRGS